jgi:hypothetical protein
MNCSLMLLRKRRHRIEPILATSDGSDEQTLSENFEDKRPHREQIYLHSQRYLKTLHAMKRLPPRLHVVAEAQRIT